MASTQTHYQGRICSIIFVHFLSSDIIFHSFVKFTEINDLVYVLSWIFFGYSGGIPIAFREDLKDIYLSYCTIIQMKPIQGSGIPSFVCWYSSTFLWSIFEVLLSSCGPYIVPKLLSILGGNFPFLPLHRSSLLRDYALLYSTPKTAIVLLFIQRKSMEGAVVDVRQDIMLNYQSLCIDLVYYRKTKWSVTGLVFFYCSMWSFCNPTTIQQLSWIRCVFP